jgi:hypothetical protein
VSSNQDHGHVVCLVVFNAFFKQYFSYFMVVSFIGGGNRQRELKLLLDMYKSAPKEQRDKVQVCILTCIYV